MIYIETQRYLTGFKLINVLIVLSNDFVCIISNQMKIQNINSFFRYYCDKINFVVVMSALQTINIGLETKTGLLYHLDVLPQTSIYQIKKQAAIFLNKKFIYFDLSYQDQLQTILTKYINQLPDYKNATFKIIEKSNQQLYTSHIKENCLNFDSSTILVTIHWKGDPYQIEIHENSNISDLKDKICSILDINEKCKIMIGDEKIDDQDKIIDHAFNQDIRLESEQDKEDCQFSSNVRLVQSIASQDKYKQDDVSGFQNRIKLCPSTFASSRFGSLKKIQSSYNPVDILVRSIDKIKGQLTVNSPNVPGKKNTLFQLQQQAKQCVSLASSVIQVEQQPRQIMIIFQNSEQTRQYTISCSKDISIREVFKKIALLQKTTVEQLLFYLIQEQAQTKIQKLKMLKASSRDSIEGEQIQEKLQKKDDKETNKTKQNQSKTLHKRSISDEQSSKVQQLFGEKKIHVIKMQFLPLPKIEEKSQNYSNSGNYSFSEEDGLNGDMKKIQSQRNHQNIGIKDQHFVLPDNNKKIISENQSNTIHENITHENWHIGEKKTFQDLKHHLKCLETGRRFGSPQKLVSSQELFKKLNKLSNQKLKIKSQFEKTDQQQDRYLE